jgi:hypothetical protein
MTMFVIYTMFIFLFGVGIGIATAILLQRIREASELSNPKHRAQ